MGRRLLVLSLILFVTSADVFSQQQECSINGESPTAKQIFFNRQTQFQCGLGAGDSERSWWQSKECSPESFERSDRVNCGSGDLMCVVPPDVYQGGYFYFCCASEDALSVADASQLQCFQLQICTTINHAEFPANVVPGTVGTIRIEITGFPQPNTSLSQPADARNVVQSDSVERTFTNFTYVVSFVVPREPGQEELDLQVDVTTPQGCPQLPATGHAKVIQNADTILEALGVTPTEPTTPSSPTPPAECECFIHLIGGIAAAVGLGVILITVVVALCVTCCVYKGNGRSLHDSETSSGSYAPGSYTAGPYDVTQVAPREEPPPVYSEIPGVGLQNGQSQGEAVTSRPFLLRLRSSERTPEETPATSETLLYPQQTPQLQPQYSFRHGLPADGSAIPNLQGLPAGTNV